MIYFVILNYDNIKKKYKQKNLISHYDALYQAHITKNQNKNDSCCIWHIKRKSSTSLIQMLS